MRDIIKAKSHLTGEYTCVLCRGDDVLTSKLTGIAPMMNFIKSGVNLNGFSVADRIVGRAAALLFVLAGISEVYAEVISHSATEVLHSHGIPFEYGTQTEYIINRAGDGMCPMEMAVIEINEPSAAFLALDKKVKELRRNNPTPENR